MKRLPEVNLRALEPEDLEMLYQLENDESIWDAGITNVPYSRHILLQYITESSYDIYVDRQVRFVVENSEGKTVGLVDLHNFNPSHQRAEVGIVIKEEFRGNGFGEAALSQLIGYVRRHLHLHQLYAVVSKDNEISLRLFDRLGFTTGALLEGWLFDGEKYHDSVIKQFFL